MIIKRAIIRYVTYFSGVSTTAISIFLINYFLDSNEFAVWGVTHSLIYILSQLGQLTYVQYVEKYFPNLDDNEKLHNQILDIIESYYIQYGLSINDLEFLCKSLKII